MGGLVTRGKGFWRNLYVVWTLWWKLYTGDPAVFDGGILDLQMPEVTLNISVS